MDLELPIDTKLIFRVDQLESAYLSNMEDEDGNLNYVIFLHFISGNTVPYEYNDPEEAKRTYKRIAAAFAEFCQAKAIELQKAIGPVQ